MNHFEKNYEYLARGQGDPDDEVGPLPTFPFPKRVRASQQDESAARAAARREPSPVVSLGLAGNAYVLVVSSGARVERKGMVNYLVIPSHANVSSGRHLFYDPRFKNFTKGGAGVLMIRLPKGSTWEINPSGRLRSVIPVLGATRARKGRRGRDN